MVPPEGKALVIYATETEEPRCHGGRRCVGSLRTSVSKESRGGGFAGLLRSSDHTRAASHYSTRKGTSYMDHGTRHTLTVASREHAGVIVVTMQGSLSATTFEQGNQELKKVVDAGAKKVVLNLADVDYISSGGIRVLILAGKQFHNVQGEMKIAAARGTVKEALDASGFNLLSRLYGDSIQLCNTEEEAVATFKR
jgi:anti-anti-sigma factor